MKSHLNKPKCEFGKPQVTFYGYQFGQEDLKPTPEKVQAIHECTPLETKAEVRRFLGMTGYLSKSIPRYYEGLPAGLFQQSPKGCHSVHSITRTLNDVEKRYTQTKKGVLCVKLANDRFSMYLLGAPRFTIVTIRLLTLHVEVN